MVVKLFGSSAKKRALQRAFAVLLLSLSFIDLAVIDLVLPERCELEAWVVSGNRATTASDNFTLATFPSTSESTPQHDSTESVPEEDCFCCCAHIIPSIYFRYPGLRLQAERGIPKLAFLPSAPPLETFHPPRIT
jgi:hypothetical protein